MVSWTLLAAAGAALLACAAPGDPVPASAAGQPTGEIDQAQLFTSPAILFRGNTANGGADVHHSYRIPAIVNAGNGTLIAIAEGRVDSANDYGNINLVMRRSLDDGATWLDQVQIWNAPDRLGTIGNPTLVYDAVHDRVWLFASENDSKHSLGGAGGLTPVGVGDRRTWVRYSDTKGATWSAPVNITSKVTPSNYTWDAMGPGAGIQVAHGDKAGRLIIPAKGRLIISDDFGDNWIAATDSKPDTNTLPTGSTPLNKTTVAESSAPGGLYVNARSQDDEHRRQIKRSSDDGKTWTAWASDAALIESPCQASVLRESLTGPGRLLFFNPANTGPRDGMRVRISYDDGETWPISRVVDAGQGGYSSMALTSGADIAALYESGVGTDTNHDIKFTRFDLSWILNGAAEPVDPDIGWAQVVRADLDGNGDDELGFYSTRDGAFAWYPMAASGQLGTRLSASTIGADWDVILGVDTDGDGADELAFYNATSGGFSVYGSTASGALGARRSAATLGKGWTSIIAADFDGDGRDELAFYNRVNGAYGVYGVNSDGTLGARLAALSLGTGWTQVVAFDANGDGRPELGFYSATSGSFAVYATTTVGALDGRQSATTLSTGWSAVVPVRVTRDGHQLAFYNRATGGFAIYAVDATGALASRLAAYPLN